MADAVAEYARHRVAADRWALGRFVVPLSRWEELQAAVRATADPQDSWHLSVLASPEDGDRLRDAMAGEGQLVVQSVECKASTPDDAAIAADIASLGLEVFVEPTSLRDFAPMATVMARGRLAAKIRTGGVTTDAFPTPAQVLDFLGVCRRAGLRFKATAGLHHAVRGEYRLTYEPSPPTGEMFGFLNVAVAAALCWHGRGDEVVLGSLGERTLGAFAFTDAGLQWRDERLTVEELADARANFFVGFGSCSFREPMAEIGLEASRRP